jgi:excisionase family DNA binding protein
MSSSKLAGRFGPPTVNNHMSNRQIRALDLLKPAEVAPRLGVSRTWLYEAARTGRIPSIRIGGCEGPLRFVPEDLQRWIDDARAEWTPGGPACPTRTSVMDRVDVLTQPGTRTQPRTRR